jgi:hypothetical protein
MTHLFEFFLLSELNEWQFKYLIEKQINDAFSTIAKYAWITQFVILFYLEAMYGLTNCI